MLAPWPCQPASPVSPCCSPCIKGPSQRSSRRRHAGEHRTPSTCEASPQQSLGTQSLISMSASGSSSGSSSVIGASRAGHSTRGTTEDEILRDEDWRVRGLQQSPAEERSTKLRMFLDSASPKELLKWARLGLFFGFTTNPTILKRDGVPCTVRSLTQMAEVGFEMGYKEVQIQAWGPNLSNTALDLAYVDARIVVKLPCTMNGIQTAALLRDRGLRTTITGVYYPHQVLVAQAVGASYVAPYLGRMGDAFGREEGFNKVMEMQAMINGCDSGLRSLVASIRSTEDLVKMTAKGCNTFTFSPDIAAGLFESPLTLRATGQFESDAQDNNEDDDL